MRRREFMSLVGGAAAAWPLAARGQPSAIPVVGFLHVGSAHSFAHLVAGLRRGLRETGYVDGRNLAIEFRWAEGHYDRLPSLAADLVRRQVAIVVAASDAAAVAAKAATATIPIIFNVGGDPVKSGLVTSLSRPGGNATGVNLFTAELAAKRLVLLHDLIPRASVIAILVNPNFPGSEASATEMNVAAAAIGRRTLLVTASSESGIDGAFATISQSRAGAILVGVDPFFNSRRAQIVALAARYAIPAMYEQREFAVAGGLMSYGTNLVEAFRQKGVYAGRILKGEKPSELPVVQMTKFELLINLKTAKALGLTIPDALLIRADEIIE